MPPRQSHVRRSYMIDKWKLIVIAACKSECSQEKENDLWHSKMAEGGFPQEYPVVGSDVQET